ncbi:AAA domain-containing protein [Gilvimarinus sp. F26214L]|uniref:AAA domain-containing protein n=1 Tax=Gilvimarinus sp. DZF01 TaxID=3461371 RepID=UPI0040456B05
MAIPALRRQGIEVKLTRRGDRRNAFRIERFTNDHGFQVYALENTAEGRKIFVPRFVFGRFRACVRNLLKDEISRPEPLPFESSVSFLNRDYYYFKSSASDIDNLIVQDIEEREGSSGYITVGRSSLQALDQLLYSDKLQHPNDVLEEIIAYHKLFQFSFVKGSKSITSDLILRKDVLQSIERYTPSLAQKTVEVDTRAKSAEDKPKQPPGKAAPKTKAQAKLYKPKLGERFNEKDIRVDYDEIFGSSRISLASAGSGSEGDGEKIPRGKSALSQFPVPLTGAEIKRFETGKYYFELSPEEASDFRERFIGDRSAEFFVGFEIVDALFSFNRSVRTFRFPLYYARVRIRESGRGVHLELAHEGRFHLNYLALAHLVEKFSESQAGTDVVERFFTNLLAQDISIDRLNDRIHVSRHMPVKEAVFDRTREILFGYQDENGKGGILADLNVRGIECDLQSVYLYRAPKLLNPIDQALDLDLDQINEVAHHSSKRFYSSLLGRFLTPEQDAPVKNAGEFAPQLWMPGALPQSTRNLVDKLNHHDIVLLEGPPGTGKTHTIMNLLLHCINSGQRVLVVSDQQAAIEALVEKLEDYLIGDDRGGAAERRWKDLLFSAIKVVDQVETGEQSLEALVANLAKSFKVQEPDAGAAPRGEKLEKDLRQLGSRIDALRTRINQTMLSQVGEEVPFDRRVLGKAEDESRIESLREFLDRLLDRNHSNGTAHKIITAFIENRCQLRDDMADCYQFFKVPTRNFAGDVQMLKDDLKLLDHIIENRPNSPEEFDAIIEGHPRHEVIRYLDSLVQAHLAQPGNGLQRFMRKLRWTLRKPLQRRAATLRAMVGDQIALLEQADSWSAELLDLLRELHESIRLGEAHRALGLFRSLQGRSSGRSAEASVQGDLEELDDCYRQQDKLVRQRLVEKLRYIVDGATRPGRRGGTDRITSIMALVDDLKQFSSLGEAGSVFEDLRQKLFETFPVWLVRKQAVPFLLPCSEQSFDLVVVDEATQCRVDDSLSLMFRARKMLVVGDDRQTVLQKDSAIDDYLFRDHELDEHLRSTQARGFKGGGSHIFGLVKAIKEASVLLDEHYRCPADIIEFSNRYVYGNELNIMQWRLPEHPSAVVVDYSEQSVKTSKKATSGKFKGIETGMIDRFMDYVVSSVKRIEKTTGKKINMETDVALCYFLLKNEPYVKAVKDTYLRKLKRGEDVLDGAGAALQGKERDYIFYLWDMTRHNLGAFKQGDDADKRKGELNVLMSRPKKKAFHFLHRNFEQLDHSRTNISSYLWRSWQRQEDKVQAKGEQGDALHDSLLGVLLNLNLQTSSQRSTREARQHLEDRAIEFRPEIRVGDASRVVDLIAFPRGDARRVIGLVDLSGFGSDGEVGQRVVDYYFQLKRVSPRIDPVFVFPHEVIDESGQSFRSLLHKLEQLDLARANSTPEASDAAELQPA